MDVTSPSIKNRHPKFLRIRVTSFRFITADSSESSLPSTILRDITVQKTIISVFTPRIPSDLIHFWPRCDKPAKVFACIFQSSSHYAFSVHRIFWDALLRDPEQKLFNSMIKEIKQSYETRRFIKRRQRRRSRTAVPTKEYCSTV